MNNPMSAVPGFSFQVFNFPVNVRWSFFLFTVLIGLSYNNLVLLLFWVVVVFVSILIHELGHAIVSNNYGRDPAIELREMGGLTYARRYSLLSYPQEIFISFAGPLAGFIVGGIVYALDHFLGPFGNPYLGALVSMVIWVNIGWGVINLVPILPLDGGSIMRNLYHWLRNPYDERVPLIISIFFGVLFCVAALLLQQLFLALLVGWLTFNNFMALRGGSPGSFV